MPDAEVWRTISPRCKTRDGHISSNRFGAIAAAQRLFSLRWARSQSQRCIVEYEMHRLTSGQFMWFPCAAFVAGCVLTACLSWASLQGRAPEPAYDIQYIRAKRIDTKRLTDMFALSNVHTLVCIDACKTHTPPQTFVSQIHERLGTRIKTLLLHHKIANLWACAGTYIMAPNLCCHLDHIVLVWITKP